MKFSPIIQQIIVDLIRAKNPVPKQFRDYNPHGKYRGEKGAPFDDVRERSKPNVSSVSVINLKGHMYTASRKVKTHDGEHTLTVDVFSKIDREALMNEMEEEVKKAGDQIEGSNLSLDRQQAVWERVDAGRQMAERAIISSSLSGESNIVGALGEKRLFVVRDENKRLKGIGVAKALHDKIYLGYLGAIGISGGGAGSTILKECEGWAREAGKPIVELEPLPDSVNFYEKMGYKGDQLLSKRIGDDVPNVPQSKDMWPKKEDMTIGEKMKMVFNHPSIEIDNKPIVLSSLAALLYPGMWAMGFRNYPAGGEEYHIYVNEYKVPNHEPLDQLNEMIKGGKEPKEYIDAIMAAHFSKYPGARKVLEKYAGQQDGSAIQVMGEIFDIIYQKMQQKTPSSVSGRR